MLSAAGMGKKGGPNSGYAVDQNEFITFNWISVKWYGSFEGVRFITRFYQNLEKYSFKRIGDDYNDI